MKITFIFLYCIVIVSMVRGQCPGELSCGEGQVHCALGVLNGLHCSTLDFSNNDHPSRNLCDTREQATNVSWWSFVGEGGMARIAITAMRQNCSIGYGVRAGILEGNCEEENDLACEADCDSDFITLSMTTIPGEFYHLWIDGCQGDVCQFNIRTLGATATPRIPRPLPMIEIYGNICPGSDIEAQLPALSSTCRTRFLCTLNDSLIGITPRESMSLPTNIDTITKVDICFDIWIGTQDGRYVCETERICTTLTLSPLIKDTTYLEAFQDSLVGGRYYDRDTVWEHWLPGENECATLSRTILDIHHRIWLDSVVCDSFTVGDGDVIRRDTSLKLWVYDDQMDTLIVTNYQVIKSFQATIDSHLMKGETYLGIEIFRDTTIAEYLISQHGCDSLVIHQIKVLTTKNVEHGVSFSIYPNVVSQGEVIHIELPFNRKVTVDLFDAKGNLIESDVQLNEGWLLAHQRPGLYFLLFHDKDTKSFKTHRLVIL